MTANAPKSAKAQPKSRTLAAQATPQAKAAAAAAAAILGQIECRFIPLNVTGDLEAALVSIEALSLKDRTKQLNKKSMRADLIMRSGGEWKVKIIHALDFSRDEEMRDDVPATPTEYIGKTPCNSTCFVFSKKKGLIVEGRGECIRFTTIEKYFHELGYTNIGLSEIINKKFYSNITKKSGNGVIKKLNIKYDLANTVASAKAVGFNARDYLKISDEISIEIKIKCKSDADKGVIKKLAKKLNDAGADVEVYGKEDPEHALTWGELTGSRITIDLKVDVDYVKKTLVEDSRFRAMLYEIQTNGEILWIPSTN
ncbi:MAG: hypothetical protein RL095_2163 [Verrucomicrobiota bacterium]